MTSTLTPLLWFIAIIAMIPLALWLLKRTPMGGATAQGAMRTIAALPISPNQRLLTVEVGQGDDRQWLVLGVTPQQISLLTEASAASLPPAPAPGMPASFSSLLRGAAGLPPGRQP